MGLPGVLYSVTPRDSHTQLDTVWKTCPEEDTTMSEENVGNCVRWKYVHFYLERFTESCVWKRESLGIPLWGIMCWAWTNVSIWQYLTESEFYWDTVTLCGRWTTDWDKGVCAWVLGGKAVHLSSWLCVWVEHTYACTVSRSVHKFLRDLNEHYEEGRENLETVFSLGSELRQ